MVAENFTWLLAMDPVNNKSKKNMRCKTVLIMKNAKILLTGIAVGVGSINGYKILLKVAKLWPQHNVFHNGLWRKPGCSQYHLGNIVAFHDPLV